MMCHAEKSKIQHDFQNIEGTEILCISNISILKLPCPRHDMSVVIVFTEIDIQFCYGP